jgi:hypothetical protein
MVENLMCIVISKIINSINMYFSATWKLSYFGNLSVAVKHVAKDDGAAGMREELKHLMAILNM